MLGLLIGTGCLVGLIGVGCKASRARHCGHYRHGGGRGFRGRPLHSEGFHRAAGEVLKRRLGIDEEQEPVVDHALRDLRSAAKELFEELKSTRPDLANAFRGEVIDDAALAIAFARHDDAVGRARRQIVSALKQIHAVLDAEQREQAANALASDAKWGW